MVLFLVLRVMEYIQDETVLMALRHENLKTAMLRGDWAAVEKIKKEIFMYKDWGKLPNETNSSWDGIN